MVIDDNFYMALALQEAWKYQLLTYPNPAVGCTVVGGHGEILAVEAHHKAGGPHAEVNALKQAYYKLTDDNYILALTDSADIHTHLLSNHNGMFEDGKRKGVTLDTFVELTHLISPLLDVTSPVSGEYRLEVGGPGIERKLTSLDHFKKSIGENVSIVYGEKEKIRGKLTAVEDENLHIQNDETSVTIPYGDVKKARTYFEW